MQPSSGTLSSHITHLLTVKPSGISFFSPHKTQRLHALRNTIRKARKEHATLKERSSDSRKATLAMATFATCPDLHRHPSTLHAGLAAISFCAKDNVDDELHGVPPATSFIFGQSQFLKVYCSYCMSIPCKILVRVDIIRMEQLTSPLPPSPLFPLSLHSNFTCGFVTHVESFSPKLVRVLGCHQRKTRY